VCQHRFWTEIYDGAKLFYLSGMVHGKYNKRDTLNLARFISIAKVVLSFPPGPELTSFVPELTSFVPDLTPFVPVSIHPWP
jgi:ribosome biogenesis protein BMS1